MRNFFEILMKQLLLCSEEGYGTENSDLYSIDDGKVKSEFRKILDKLVINIIERTFENETLISALLRLARIERIIIILHFICGMSLSEIVYLLDTNLNSVYVQKCTAIKHLKKLLSKE